MVTGVATSGNSSSYPVPTGGGNVAALQGQLAKALAQLNDWTTCVSAKTPKGRAEIQRLSGEVSADQQKIVRSQQLDAAGKSKLAEERRGTSIDLWV